MPLNTSSTRATASCLWELVRHRRRRAAWVLVLVGVADVTGLVGPRLIGIVVDAATSGGRQAQTVIYQAAIAFGVVIVVGAALTYVGQWKAAALGEDALAELRTKVFDRAISLPLETIEQAGTGDLVSRVTDDVNDLSATARSTVPLTVFALVQLVLAIVGLILVSPTLALTATVIAAPTLLSARWYLPRARGLYRAERERGAEWAGELHEAYRGVAAVRSLRSEQLMRERLFDRGQGWFDARLATVRARTVLRGVVRGSQAIGLAVVILVGTVLVGRHSLSVGDVTAAALYLTTLVDVVSTLLDQLDTLQNAFAAAARLAGVLEEPAEHDVPVLLARPGEDCPVGAVVELVDVTFGYGAGRPVVRSIDLAVAVGERVALVGPSGAGKSTVAKLIAGIHQPRSGLVTLGGHPLEELSTVELRGRLMLVAQETHTFARSVADNLHLGCPDATEGQIREALEAVGASAWVDGLPEGIHTVVGADGVALTPGAAQQLALARLLCRRPDVAVLDEATSSMPVQAAIRAETALESTLQGHTIISVIHRLESIRSTDRVVMIERGVLVDDGPRHLLVDAGGRFAELWAQWRQSRYSAVAVHPNHQQ